MKAQPARTRRLPEPLGSYGRLGLLLTAVGVILAIDTLTSLSFLYKFWPLLVALLGGGFIGIYLRRGRREAIYVGIGTFLLGASALTLYCSLTSWAVLAALWPLFIGLLGISFLSGYVFGSRTPVLLLAGLVLLSVAAVFVLVFAVDPGLWWTVFLLAGVSFVIFDKARPGR